MTRLSDEAAATLATLEKRATPGPWAWGDGELQWCLFGPVLPERPSLLVAQLAVATTCLEDREFIVAVRNVLPALLADRAALVAEVAARDDRIARLLTTLDRQDAAKLKAEDSVATLTAKVDRLAAAHRASTPPPGPA